MFRVNTYRYRFGSSKYLRSGVRSGTQSPSVSPTQTTCLLTWGVTADERTQADLYYARTVYVRARRPYLVVFGRQHHAHHSCSRFLRRHGVGTDLTTISSDLAVCIWSPPPLSVCLVVQSTPLLILLKPRLFS